MRRICILLLCVWQTLLFSEENVGKVVAIEGTVRAISASQSARALTKGSPIYVAETIVVADAARVQIKFSDGGLLNLISDTQFRVDEYRATHKIKKERFSANLLKGGFRLLSGEIAKKNPEEYEIKTPTSTIGIRGTILEARIVGNEVYFACPLGQIVLTNQAGTTVIGVGERSQFAVISSPDAPSRLLPERPPSLERMYFKEPKGGLPISTSKPVVGSDRGQKAAFKKNLTPGTLQNRVKIVELDALGHPIKEETIPTDIPASESLKQKGASISISGGC